MFDASPPSSGRAVDLTDIAESEPPSAAKPILETPRRAREESHPDVDFLLGLSGSPGTTAALASPSLADLARKAPSEPPPEVVEEEPTVLRPAPVADSPTATTTKATTAAAKPVAKPVTTKPPEAPTTSEKKRSNAWLLVVLGLVALAGIAFAMSKKDEPVAPEAPVAAKPPETAPAPEPAAVPSPAPEPVPAPSANAADPPVTMELPDGPAPAPVAPATKPAAPSVANDAPAVAAKKEPASAPAERTPAAAAPKAEPAKPVTPRPEIPKAAAGTPFDRAAAAAALATAASQASSTCKKPGDPSGVASVAVTFAPSGRVTSATVSGPPFSGTATGGCIASTLRRAQIPAFDGDKVTVGKTIVIQ